MVAVLDLDTDKHFHIAKVMAITGTTTTLWYAATKGKVLKTAVWKFMYNSPSNWGQGFTYAKPNLLNSDDFLPSWVHYARTCRSMAFAHFGAELLP